MYQMVLLVLDDVNNCTSVLDAWEAIGVTGITILDSTGLGRVRAASSYRDDFPLMPSISNLMKSREERHRTMFTVVDSNEMVDKIIQVTQEITGGLDAPNQGVIFVLPVTRAIGLQNNTSSEE